MRVLYKFVAALTVAIPLVAAAQTAYVTRNVNVRAGPDSSYPLVATLRAGTAVSVGGCIASYTWCDVYTGDLRGFVYASYLTYPYQANQVPIYSYGPALGLPLITFSLGTYWDDYYRGRPFYNKRSYWAARPYHAPPPRFSNNWRPPPYHGNDHRPPGNNYHTQGNNNRPPGNNNRPPPQHQGGQNRPPQHQGEQNRPPPQHQGGQNRPSHNQGYVPKGNDASGGEAGG